MDTQHPPYYYAFECLPNIWMIRADALEKQWDSVWETWWMKQHFQIGFYLRQTSISPFWKKKMEPFLQDQTFDWIQHPLPALYQQGGHLHSEHVKQWLHMWKQYTPIFEQMFQTNYTYCLQDKHPFRLFFMCDNHLERSIYFFLGILIQFGILSVSSIQLDATLFLPNSQDIDFFKTSNYMYRTLFTSLKPIQWK
jgi:hypothetical protein